MKKSGRVIVVDDNAGIRATLKILLPLRFADIEILSSPKELLSKVSTFAPDVVLLDMNFTSEVNTGNEGLFWLSELKAKYPKLQVVLFTAYADISLAVEGMKRGAFDFVVKPWDNDKLLDTLAAACERTRELTNDNSNAPSQPKNSDMYWGSSDAMRQIRATVEKIAPTDATVLITGENGTGKDVLAREIHMRSERHKKPMVAVDAGAITETLFESELFGHVKGAFTDAHTDHVGKFEQANGSTLFLDEIGNIPLHLQAKLLRVLQNRSVMRVGDSTARPIDIRLICATNMNLEQLVREGKFREDLYYRINTMHIELLPLRERRDDIVPLAERFVIEFANKYHRSVIGVDAQAASKLREHRWRGNIRELQNCIEKAVILSEGSTLTANDIQLENSSDSDDNLTGLDAAEEKLVRSAVERCNGNISAAAKMLGISRPTLYTKMKKYGM
ncbi:MAG: sigma-54-dependent Fis family transcriptional regulator [Bacteroidales bacterium]|nr:sigma-54-dependent Fis family transcriptional regulator [Bacteroidales bacterium]